MELELKEKSTMSREDAAARLHAIADELACGNDIIVERGRARFVAKVPDEVALALKRPLGAWVAIGCGASERRKSTVAPVVIDGDSRGLTVVSPFGWLARGDSFPVGSRPWACQLVFRSVRPPAR